MPRYFKREGRGKGYEDVTREVDALRADLEQTTDERNALLHARTALAQEMAEAILAWDADNHPTSDEYPCDHALRDVAAKLRALTAEQEKTR